MAHREYEKTLRQLEAECRTHIKCEQQMKLHIECLQEKLDQIIKDNELKKIEVGKEHQEEIDMHLKELSEFKKNFVNLELDYKLKQDMI